MRSNHIYHKTIDRFKGQFIDTKIKEVKRQIILNKNKQLKTDKTILAEKDIDENEKIENKHEAHGNNRSFFKFSHDLHQ